MVESNVEQDPTANPLQVLITPCLDVRQCYVWSARLDGRLPIVMVVVFCDEPNKTNEVGTMKFVKQVSLDVAAVFSTRRNGPIDVCHSS